MDNYDFFMPVELARYIAAYIREELARGNGVTTATILDAVQSYNGGAR